MTARVHPTALIDRTARIGAGVEIGPWVLVGPNVEVGDGCTLGPRVTLERNVKLAQRVRIGVGAVLGSDPQDISYQGEETWVEVGHDTAIREFVTINRGTKASGATRVGARCFLMTYSHLGHDCQVGDDVTIANSTEISGSDSVASAARARVLPSREGLRLLVVAMPVSFRSPNLQPIFRFHGHRENGSLDSGWA